jgi:uncharacterized protein with HEPN domain
MKDERLYLIHIRECLDRIKRYTGQGREAFLTSELIQDAVLRNLQTMAESVKRLSQSFKEDYPEVEWQEVIGLRNVLVHDYLDIDEVEIWDIVAQDLPPFERHIETILQKLGGIETPSRIP